MFLALERKNLDRSKLQIEKVHGNIGLRNSHYFDTRPSNSCTTTANLLQERRVPFKMEKLLEYSVRCRHANNFHEPRFLPIYIMNEVATLPTASPKISYYYFAISMTHYWIQIQIFPRINSEFASSSPVGAAESSSSN